MLAQRGKGISPAGDDLMGIALMTHVKYDPVVSGIVHPVQGNRQLNGAQVGGKMAPGTGDIIYNEGTQFFAERAKFIRIQFFHIVR